MGDAERVCVRTPEFGKPEGRTADPSASLGMTISFGNAKYRFQDELSSRPKRSVVEGSAVRPSAFPNSGQSVKDLPGLKCKTCPRLDNEAKAASGKPGICGSATS